MLGGELTFHLLNVLLLTLGIAPLVLWRYRRAVLAGMQGRAEVVLPVAAPSAPRPPATVAGIDPLRWETRLRRRVFMAVLAATFLSAVPLSGLFFYLGGEPTTPVHLYLKAGVMASAAVPVFAVLAAIPFWRALGRAVHEHDCRFILQLSHGGRQRDVPDLAAGCGGGSNVDRRETG